MADLVFSPSEFVAVFNQTIEQAYPQVIIEGELSNFKVSRNRWVYFDIKDEYASVKFFGSVYQLPGPLEDGLLVQVIGYPKLHHQFGFSITFQSIQPVGEGSLKKAADLLFAKLSAEGLFAPERKRQLPQLPHRIGLITAATSAAAADFLKIIGERWAGLEILLADVLVQGQEAPAQIVSALEYFEQITPLADILVVTRGGGSTEDLAAFNDERVVRAIAGSRTPTLVAVGHEIDISLAEMAADVRASTPSNAAQLAVPDKKHILSQINYQKTAMHQAIKEIFDSNINNIAEQKRWVVKTIEDIITDRKSQLLALKKLMKVFDPKAVLRRGYAIITKGTKHVKSVKQLKQDDSITAELSDGTISAIVGKSNG
ncbi:MAG TPA: exodeoxyribonuclease VII large subunit [Candidatus Saccharimonadales bacterium]|nr:exodeoxyribonuclease VII large subunit [Candidatus Saccharimonadales bacterium]